MPLEWPSILPELDAQGYGEQPRDGAIRTQMDSGPVNTRARYTALTDEVASTVPMTRAEYITLQAFYRDVTRMGSIEFEMFDALYGSPSMFRFTAHPRITGISGDVLQVSITLERMP